MANEKTAVLIHGWSIKNPEWEWVVWGDPSQKMLGRASRGLELACSNDASLVYVGGGGSHENGKAEATITYEYMMAHAEELVASGICRREILEHILKDCVYVDPLPKNTFDEITRFVNRCIRNSIKRLILVSSPFHGPRCLKDGDILRLFNKHAGLRVAAMTSDIDPSNESVLDVAVVEPRHDANPHVRRMLHGIPKERVSDFARELDELVSKYTAIAKDRAA